MRRTINISVQEDLYQYIRERTKTSHFGSVSEYVRWLVQSDRESKMRTKSKETPSSRIRTANETMLIGMFEEFLDDYRHRNEVSDL